MISIAWALLSGGCAPVCGDVALLEQRECAVEAVIETIDERYPADFIARKELDIAGLYAAWRALPAAHSDPEDFGAALQRGVGGLQDGHTGVIGEYARMRFLHVRAYVVDGDVIMAHTPPDVPELLPGDRVLSIGGVLIDEALAGAFALGSTVEAQQNARIQSAFTGGGVFDGGLVVERAGVEVQTAVYPDGISDYEADTHFIHQGVDVIRLSSFEHPEELDWFDQRMNFIAEDAEGLVLDLRGNPGGSAWLVDSVLGRLFEEPPPDYPIVDAQGEPGRTGGKVVPRGAVYTGPLAVLVDAETASASSYAAHRIRSSGRGLVCGAHTGGGAGAPTLRVVLSPGLVFVGVERYLVGPNGEDLELGVAPDPICAVSWTRAQLEAGLDASHGDLEQDLALALSVQAVSGP